MGAATRKSRGTVMALVTVTTGILTCAFAALALFCISTQHTFHENGSFDHGLSNPATTSSPGPFQPDAHELSSQYYGAAGGVTDFFFGPLPTMDPSRLREPNTNHARYLDYQCAEASESHVPWVFSIAVLNPKEGDISLTLKQIAKRNREIRNNKTNIESVTSVCGGVLIAPSWGLTAHHCLTDHRYLKVVIYGRKNFEDLRGIRNFISEIDKVYFHPGYNDETNEHDIALLKFKKKISFDAVAKPACLPNSNVIPKTEKNCSYAGWGLKTDVSQSTKRLSRGFHSYLSNSRLTRFAVATEDPTTCQRRYKRLKYDVNYNLCDKRNSSRIIGNFGNDTTLRGDTQCSGFSGGPLTCLENNRWLVYGIVNWGEESCDLKAGRGYALISTRMRWICCTTMLRIPNCVEFECDKFR